MFPTSSSESSMRSADLNLPSCLISGVWEMMRFLPGRGLATRAFDTGCMFLASRRFSVAFMACVLGDFDPSRSEVSPLLSVRSGLRSDVADAALFIFSRDRIFPLPLSSAGSSICQMGSVFSTLIRSKACMARSTAALRSSPL